MTARPEAIEASYATCRRIARRSGSNFYRCFAVLPRPQRRAMDALYAFMRYTDDLGDEEADVPSRRAALAQWRQMLHAALDTARGRESFSDNDSSPCQDPSAEKDSRPLDAATILPALADTVDRFAIPHEHLEAVIDGVEMDLDTLRYETFDQLSVYCHRVASAVGLACIHVWGFRDDGAFEPARACGLAFQLTNILRDVKEDAAMGRVYVPLEDLRRCDYPVEGLLQGQAGDHFDRLMRLEIGRAEEFYHQGAELLQWLEPGGRRVCGMMIDVYHRLLARIQSDPRQVFAHRVRLGRLEKACIAARWALLPPRRSALP